VGGTPAFKAVRIFKATGQPPEVGMHGNGEGFYGGIVCGSSSGACIELDVGRKDTHARVGPSTAKFSVSGVSRWKREMVD